MSRIFISHSSEDVVFAVAIRDWLEENGWDDVFLDLDPRQGIQPGQRWERALHENASRCQAVVFLVSRNWLGSDWCRREYELARKLNKRIFVALIEDIGTGELPTYLTETYQAVSLASGTDHRMFRVVSPVTHEEGHVTFSNEGLTRLKSGLERGGLDARFFQWPPPNEPERSPYRGLEPLESVDAGIFFGRDAPIVEALDCLRGLREGACPRLFVMLGASGAGKSSFLRAGLLPRLARDERNFLPLLPIRPERAALTGANGLVATIAAACLENDLPITRATVRDAALAGATALSPILRQLAARVQVENTLEKPPTIVIAVDQAEELFRAEGSKEGEDLLRLIRDFVSTDDPAMIVLFAIRSDSYDAIEHAKPLEGLRQTAFPLLPMPRGAYQTVIEGPIQRLVRAGRKFEIDPALIALLLADIESGAGSDALPLLAFTLEQLYSDHEAAGKLTRKDYESYGGLRGAIDAAVARAFEAADKDLRIPVDKEARLTLLRRGLIPWLAGIDPETKTPRRRRAPASQIPREAQPIIDLLVEQRLLTRALDDTTREVTLEPAHEALLRQWGSLKGWLDEDFARLVTLEGVQRAAREWDANARDPAWASHSGARLGDAIRLDTRPDLAALLTATDRSYLAACQEKQTQSHARELALAAAERRAAQRTRAGLIASSTLAALAIIAAAFGFYQAKSAQQQKAIAEEQKTIAQQQTAIAKQDKTVAEQRSAILAASVSESFTAEGSLDQALLLMLDASHAFNDENAPDEIRIAFNKALEKTESIATGKLFPNMQVFETADALIILDPVTKNLWKITDSIEPKKLSDGQPGDSGISAFKQTSEGKSYIVLRENLKVETIDVSTGARKTIGVFPQPTAPAGKTYDTPGVSVTDDGLIVRSFSVSSTAPAQNGDSANFFQIFDTSSGQLTQGEIKGVSRILRKSLASGFYGAGDDRQIGAGVDIPIYQVTATKSGLVPQKAKVNDADSVAFRYGECAAKMPASARIAVVKEFDFLWDAGSLACKKIGSNYLIEYKKTRGISLELDSLFRANGKEIVLRDTLSSAAPGDVTDANLAWVGLSPTLGHDTHSDKVERLGLLQNRSAYVLEHEADNTPSAGDEDEKWTLLLNYRHPTYVEYGRFLSADQLLVLDSESGQSVVHYLGDKPHQNLFPTKDDPLIGSSTPVETRQKGTCVGHNTPQMESGILPDGRKIIFNVQNDDGTYKDQMKISGSTDTVIPLGEHVYCLQFSTDWKKLLIVGENAIPVYDFQKVLSTGSLAGAQISSIPLSGPIHYATSAFFADPAGQSVVTSNWTNRVLLWKQDGPTNTWSSSELYKGDNDIVYAEPDAAIARLILIERSGTTAHGFLYSVPAHQSWFDFGTDYKSMGATFTQNGEIGVSHYLGGWTEFIPLLPMSALAELAKKQLTPECRPANAGDYRHSTCWPATFQ